MNSCSQKSLLQFKDSIHYCNLEEDKILIYRGLVKMVWSYPLPTQARDHEKDWLQYWQGMGGLGQKRQDDRA
jgi:hypothetical protein